MPNLYKYDFIDQYIGNGLPHNDIFNPLTAGVNVSSGVDKIHNSIYSILATRVGERIMMPEFGSRLYMIVFDPADAVFADLADFYIRDALGKWEKRIEVVNISISKEDIDENIVPITISYKITNSNIFDTYVYPFNVNTTGELEIYEQGDNEVEIYEGGGTLE